MDRWERLPRASSPSWGLAIATDGAPDDSRLLTLARRFLSGEAIDWAKEGVTESEVREGMKRLQALLGRPEPSESTETWAATPAGAPIVSIGPYRLLRKLGERGMGEVWLAEQVEPVRRRVALKVIRAGMDSRQVVARFEADSRPAMRLQRPIWPASDLWRRRTR